jgi:hypothetical protein
MILAITSITSLMVTCVILMVVTVTYKVDFDAAYDQASTAGTVLISLVARGGGQPRLTKIFARALLIVIAFGVFGVFVHKPLETAFQCVLPIRKTPAANTH